MSPVAVLATSCALLLDPVSTSIAGMPKFKMSCAMGTATSNVVFAKRNFEAHPPFSSSCHGGLAAVAPQKNNEEILFYSGALGNGL